MSTLLVALSLFICWKNVLCFSQCNSHHKKRINIINFASRIANKIIKALDVSRMYRTYKNLKRFRNWYWYVWLLAFYLHESFKLKKMVKYFLCLCRAYWINLLIQKQKNWAFILPCTLENLEKTFQSKYKQIFFIALVHFLFVV